MARTWGLRLKAVGRIRTSSFLLSKQKAPEHEVPIFSICLTFSLFSSFPLSLLSSFFVLQGSNHWQFLFILETVGAFSISLQDFLPTVPCLFSRPHSRYSLLWAGRETPLLGSSNVLCPWLSQLRLWACRVGATSYPPASLPTEPWEMCTEWMNKLNISQGHSRRTFSVYDSSAYSCTHSSFQLFSCHKYLSHTFRSQAHGQVLGIQWGKRRSICSQGFCILDRIRKLQRIIMRRMSFT